MRIFYITQTDVIFSAREVSALADAGLEAFTDENAPLWFWLKSCISKVPEWLILSTIVGPDKRRINAFKVLKLVQQDISVSSKSFTDFKIFDIWFADVSDQLKIAALDFLASCGTRDQIKYIQAELDKINYGTRSAAQKALLEILVKYDPKATANLLLEMTNLPRDKSFQETIENILSQVPNDILISALKANSVAVRTQALTFLDDRDALTDEGIVTLLKDTSVQIRTLALRLLEERSRCFSEEEAELHLVRKKAKSIFSSATLDDEGQEALNEYKQRQQMALSVDTLELASRTEPFTSDNFYFSLCKKEPSNRLTSLRINFDNQFLHFFDEYVDIIRKVYATTSSNDMIEKMISESQNYWKRKWMRNALDIIIGQMDGSDINRVRKVLDQDNVDPRKGDIVFLERYGSFEDIARIVKIDSDYRSSNSPSTIFGHVRNSRQVAKAALTLAKENVVSLLAIELPAEIILSIIAGCKQNSLRALKQAQIDYLLFHSSDNVRKVTALKMIITNSSKIVRTTLEPYINTDGHRFYNVIFWLDLVASYPASIAREIASNEMHVVTRGERP